MCISAQWWDVAAERNNFLNENAHNKVRGLSWLTWSQFLDRDIALQSSSILSGKKETIWPKLEFLLQNNG